MDFVNNPKKFINFSENIGKENPQISTMKTKMTQQVFTDKLSENYSSISVIKDNFPAREAVEEVNSEVNEEFVARLQRICRFCLVEGGKMQNIYEESNENVVKMLKNFAKIEISQDDILPPIICVNCYEQIERVYEFKNQIEMSEVTLRNLVNTKSYQIVTVAPLDDPIIQSCDDTLVEISETQMSNSMDNIPATSQESIINHSQEIELFPEVQVITVINRVNDQEMVKDEQELQDTTNDVPSDRESIEELDEEMENTEKDCICYLCNKSFPDNEEFINHLNNHSDKDKKENKDPQFKCKECNETFQVESDLQIHNNSLHAENGKKQCSFCKKEVTTKVQLRRHIKTHFQEKPHKCTICDKGFPEMASLTRHLRSHSGQQRVKKHLCTVCGKGYYDAYSLSIHTRNHTGERPFICSICGKSFIDGRLLNSHMKVHSDVKPYKCTVCQRTFTYLSTLTTHLRTHTGEKPYVCTVCGKSFIQSSNMTLHMRTHSGVKPYKCETCGRAFASSSALVTHNRIHTGEKPYKCSMCGKAFARLDLKGHMRTHTGEKPYKCSGQNCHKKFTTRGQLNQHMRIHREDRSLVCRICQTRCYSSANYKSHMKSHENSGNINENLPKFENANDVIIYAKSNSLIVQEIDVTTEEGSQGCKSNAISYQVEDQQDQPEISKYIVSNVIQVPYFISESNCENVVNVNEIN